MTEPVSIVLSSDHTGIDIRRIVAAHLEKRGYRVVDVGPGTAESTDYPIWGEKAARLVQKGEARFGIIICGTGFGISLTANKLKGIRCVVCSEPYTALLARQHNDANMLAFGARVVGQDLALMIVDHFLAGVFEGGRHARRIGLVAAIEEGEGLK